MLNCTIPTPSTYEPEEDIEEEEEENDVVEDLYDSLFEEDER